MLSVNPISSLSLSGSRHCFVCFKSESESEVAQSCLTLCDPVDCSPPGSSIHGILQARILEWVAISFSTVCFNMYVNVILVRCYSFHSTWVFQNHSSFFIFFLAASCGMRDLSSLIKQPMAPALGLQSLKHWTTRQVPSLLPGN